MILSLDTDEKVVVDAAASAAVVVCVCLDWVEQALAGAAINWAILGIENESPLTGCCCWAVAVVRTNQSAIEYEPAILIAQPLVVKHEFSDFTRKLCALPLALQATRLHTFIFRSRCACSTDRVSCCTQFVSSHMRHRRSLSGSVSRFSCRAAQRSGSTHRVSGGGTGLHHRNFPSHPSVRLLNRPARTVITGSHLLEEMQDVLGAVSRPHSKQAMVGVL